MTKIQKLKQELKLEAAAIRQNRSAGRFNQSHEARNLPDRKEVVRLLVYPWVWRHRHIAYCLLRGRTYEQIENKVKEGNEPDWKLIEKIKEDYYEAPKALCVSAV